MRLTTIVVASMALSLFAFCEIGLLYPVAWWLYLAMVLLFGSATIRRTPLRNQAFPALALVVFIAAAAVLYLVEWSSRKTFLRDLHSIRPGMTEAQAKQIMRRYMEGTGWPAAYDAPSSAPATLRDAGSGATYHAGTSPSGELTLHDSLVFRHSTNGRFNSDWGIVSISNGIVVEVRFSPD